MKFNKNLIMQIFWIAAIGVIIYFVNNGQDEKQIVAPPATSVIEQMCMERAIEKSNEFQVDEGLKRNPYLPGIEEKAPQIRGDIKIKEYRECIDIWLGPIEEK